MTLTAQIMKAALNRWVDKVEAVAPELNELDGKLGDGDLGATLQKCAANIRAALPAMPEDDLAGVFKSCAMACTKASGSSFGTLLAVACLTVAKQLGDRKELAWNEISELLGSVLAALSARGGASLSDKTVLDTLDAARSATEGLDAPAEQKARAGEAVERTIAEFRDKPNKIGRARMFSERSVGMDDPGMIAFRYMLQAL
ncbi:dihydroxyacetone kinase, C-terminal domain [Faunimonas pinastri]|uniref:Dihydroxyacetone kinase, C-terminal domain n=1 Tax=Faunimonas pinastri TaxID=1855383 RepID=A0A1H9EM79_9HYPH|nr:DAK2 domain-containing protein [Faunimonas pinastri]SEQ26702.1 dihydroxyacetone kinase, C-terminal domain [Faunimonas pinastri]